MSCPIKTKVVGVEDIETEEGVDRKREKERGRGKERKRRKGGGTKNIYSFLRWKNCSW